MMLMPGQARLEDLEQSVQALNLAGVGPPGEDFEVTGVGHNFDFDFDFFDDLDLFDDLYFFDDLDFFDDGLSSDLDLPSPPLPLPAPLL